MYANQTLYYISFIITRRIVHLVQFGNYGICFVMRVTAGAVDFAYKVKKTHL